MSRPNYCVRDTRFKTIYLRTPSRSEAMRWQLKHGLRAHTRIYPI